MKKHIVRIAIGIAIMLFFVIHAAERFPTADGRVPFINQLDNIIYDTRLNLTMPRGPLGSDPKVDERIVILDIDEKSLAEVGRWPWSRNLMADVVNNLFDRYQIALLGFDVIWAEPDTSSGIGALDALAQKDLKQVAGFQDVYAKLRPRLDNDGWISNDRDRQTEYQGVKRRQKIPKLFRSFDRFKTGIGLDLLLLGRSRHGENRSQAGQKKLSSAHNNLLGNLRAPQR